MKTLENSPRFSNLLKRVLQHPLTRGIDVDAANSIEIHRRMIESKPLLYKHYLRWYRECCPAFEETRNLDGDVVEIGCGAGFLERMIPGLIKTDIAPNPFASRVVDAMKLDFPDESLKAVFVISVLHHIPLPGRFLHEAARCLKPGGRLVMLEPSNNFLQRLLTRYFEHYEYFDDTIKDWVNGGDGRMTNANMALPWVIFVRDRARFEREYPSLEIKAIRHHTFFSYIVTGGMTYRSFLPSFASPLIDFVETLARPFMAKIGTMMTIDVVKR